MQDWKEDVERLVLCSGKVYYDLERHPERATADTTAIARAELLYPFPKEELAAVLSGYPSLETLIWAQEEPKNMGAWRSVRHRLEDVAAARRASCATRAGRARPRRRRATRRPTRSEQARIVSAALGLAPEEEAPGGRARAAGRGRLSPLLDAR